LFDRLETLTYHDNTTEVIGYDENSNVNSFKNRKDQTITYGYDALNRLKEKHWPNDERIITYTYYISGRLAEVDDNGDITKFTYDRLGRLTQVVEKFGTPYAKTVAYEYDNIGRRTKLTYPDNYFIKYYYDAMSRLQTVKQSGYITLAWYGYDELSRRTALILPTNNSYAFYDYQDKVEGDNLGNGLESLTNFINGIEEIYEYTYDKVGNRKTMTVDSAQHNYTYDKIYQLTNVTYPGSTTVTYNYDSVGNRTSVVNGGTTVYELNTKGINQYGTVGGVSYSYDNNGNLTSDGTYTYIYDCENHLTEVRQGGNTVATYTYDFAGRRISKTVATTTTKYCYDGYQVIAEYQNDVLARKYVYGPGIDEPICMIASGQRYYYHYDGLGSVVALSNMNGQFVESYSYDVFGQPSNISSVGNPYFFTGRRFDLETGLYYYRARYYNPRIGRFMQTDPISMLLQAVSLTQRARMGSFSKYPYVSKLMVQRFLQFDPIGRFLSNEQQGSFSQMAPYGFYTDLNLYTYCANNPLNYIDPYGLGFWKNAWSILRPWVGGVAYVVGGGLILTATSPVWITAGAVIATGGLALWIWDIVDTGEMLEHPPGSDDARSRSRMYEDALEETGYIEPSDPPSEPSDGDSGGSGGPGGSGGSGGGGSSGGGGTGGPGGGHVRSRS